MLVHFFSFDERLFQYGDTPTCLNQNPSNDVYNGVTANVQGNGETLETEVTVISNEECREKLNQNPRLNTTLNESVRTQVTEQLPYGLNYGMFWSVIY